MVSLAVEAGRAARAVVAGGAAEPEEPPPDPAQVARSSGQPGKGRAGGVAVVGSWVHGIHLLLDLLGEAGRDPLARGRRAWISVPSMRSSTPWAAAWAKIAVHPVAT
jgi:hypothetical protein